MSNLSPKREKSLTAKQRRFVEEYLIDLNATQAAIRAKYSKKTAMEQGYQLLHKTSVQKAIALAIEERSNKTKINAEYVLQRLVEIDQMDIADIINDDLTVKSITQWPEVWRKTISSVDVVEQTIGSGADAVTAFTKKLKLPDKVRNIELIGKHVDIQAWNEKKEISGALSLTGILDEIDGDTTGLPSEE